ncbi:LCP family protein [Streptomyces sp. B1I3]|uniref:LCP family protein n=1 Tax=Streptomyces sp. B1I3 TaxID=3042264 RepID=UPI00277EF6BF|nr:LCP family protein [Streptomyces sp. B1I3]MDQ0793271.1 LCP family protein required for cell wall assembly [Streptomyces sp. B1I3]
MDAHTYEGADEADPVDQWVVNPETGHYELRLDAPSATRPGDGSGAAPASGGRTAAPASARVPGRRNRRDAPPSHTQHGSGRRKRKQRGRRKVLIWTGGALALVLVGSSAYAYYWYDRLDGNISTVDVGDVGSDTVLEDGPANILIIGNDVRVGKGNEAYGNRTNVTGHADTTLLFHISGDRSNATVVSIPRDLMTTIPDCGTKQSDGSTKVVAGSTSPTRFNESYGVNGRDPGCTMRTVEAITHLEVDHFMMFDFNAVKTLSTAVGGVKVCLKEPLKDEDGGTGLDLPAGESTIAGEDALSFLRNRHGLKNESDLDRIEMQQKFVASMMRQLKEETLSSPMKMLDVAEAATKALTVDKGIGSAGKLVTLARELGKIDLKNITLMTVPVVDNPAEPEPITVVLNPVEAPKLFSMLQNDVSLTEVKKDKKAAKDKQAALLEGPRAEASAVRVDLANGGAPAGSAGAVLAWLQNSKGVARSSNVGNAPKNVARTTLEYGPNQADQARELADLMGLPASALKPGTKAAAEKEPMTLVLGPDFTAAGTPIAPPKKVDVKQSRADEDACGK